MLDLMRWPRDTFSLFDALDSFPYSGEGAGYGRGHLWNRRASYPLINVWSSADGVVVDAELPGVDPKDVDISVQGDELSLRGKVNAAQPEGKAECHRRERPEGEFIRTLLLPFRADANGVKASYKNGILRISIPRSAEEKPRKVAIEAA